MKGFEMGMMDLSKKMGKKGFVLFYRYGEDEGGFFFCPFIES